MIYRNINPNPSPDVSASASDITPEQNDNMPLLKKIETLSFDIEKLQWSMKNYVLNKYEMFQAGGPTEKRPKRKYGGWSLTSSNGEVYDGWQSVNGWKDNKFHLDLAYQNGFRPRWIHTTPTDICQGYFKEIIDILKESGFYPHAVRIWSSPPGGHHIGPHTDGPDNMYSVRLHIPIITNEECIHEWYATPEDFKTHIPADGSAYMFRTNILHDTYNHGKTERYHIIAEVYDTKHVIPGFEYNNIINVDSRVRKEIKYFLGIDYPSLL
jgi:hypothetical protein